MLKYFFILLFFASISIVNLNAQVLNGTYTIGGTSPDYQDFTEAVDDLNTNGISGEVVFNVRPGTYEEQIRIYEYPTVNYGDRVIFQSETGNNEDVVLRHEHFTTSPDFNFTIYVDGADYITFNHLTIQADKEMPSSNEKNRVIYITNNSNNVTFHNNIIKSWRITGFQGETEYCIFSGATASGTAENDSITFSNNTIIGGYNGLHFEEEYSSTGFPTHRVIENNTFYDQTRESLYIMFGSNSKILKNEFYQSDLGQNSRVIRIQEHLDTFIFDGNYIHLTNGGYGIVLDGVKSGSIVHKQVTNNTIIMDNADANYSNPFLVGIDCGFFTDSILIAHNSINLLPGATDGYSIYINDEYENWIYNNHLINYGDGVGLFSAPGSNPILLSDYNNFYSSNGTIAQLNGTSYTTTTALNTDYGTEEFSSTEDPEFINDMTLIPLNPNVYNTGLPLSTVPFDFYGSARSTTNPDIGVYEGEVPAEDVGIFGSIFDNYTPCTGDSIPIYVNIKNFGTSPLTSAVLTYENNGTILNSVNWTGNLAQNDVEDSIYIGYVYFEDTSSIDITFWSSSPNGQTDLINQNDTLSFTATPAMSGAFTVGDNASDFLTLTTAVNELQSRGVCGAVYLNVVDGEYEEQIYIPAIPGASSTNTITIQSQSQDSSAVTFWHMASNSADNYTFMLEGANYIRIKHLTLEALGSSYKRALYCYYDADNNIFSNNVFHSTFTPNPNDYRKLVHIKGSSNITIENNYFENGGHALYIEPLGSNGTVYNMEVTDNYITGVRGNVFLQSIDTLVFSNNFTDSPSDIDLNDCGGPILVEENEFYTGGIFDINGLNGDANTLIKNNFLAIATRFSWCSNVRFVNNSVNSSPSLYLMNNLSDIELYNNSFVAPPNYLNVPQSNYNNSVYFIHESVNSSDVSSDYNAFYTENPNGFLVDYDPLTFSVWKSQMGLDQNSFFGKIYYVSYSDLHSLNSSLLSNNGISLPDVTEDIDGEVRSLSTPDIGADEFEIDSSTFHNVELVDIYVPDTSSCDLADSVKIKVVNHSAFQIDSLTITFRLFGNVQDSSVYYYSIPSGDTINIPIQSFLFNSNTYYELEIELSKPNGQIDNYYNDNYQLLTYHHMGSVTILDKKDDWCVSDHELYIKNFPHDSILWSTGDTGRNTIVNTPGTYSVTVTDFRGCIVTDTIVIN